MEGRKDSKGSGQYAKNDKSKEAKEQRFLAKISSRLGGAIGSAVATAAQEANLAAKSGGETSSGESKRTGAHRSTDEFEKLGNTSGSGGGGGKASLSGEKNNSQSEENISSGNDGYRLDGYGMA